MHGGETIGIVKSGLFDKLGNILPKMPYNSFRQISFYWPKKDDLVNISDFVLPTCWDGVFFVYLNEGKAKLWIG